MATISPDKLQPYKFIIKLTDDIGMGSKFVFLAEEKAIAPPVRVNI